MGAANPAYTARFLGAFFDELSCWGVRDVVISPGSRSTPLSMTAFEMHRRFPEKMRVFVDVDERGAAFFALGLSKAGGRPTALICTSGTAVANYYPAVMEAESSRVPLIVLTGDRPPRLQGLGAPQTCDQLNAYGNHVRAFRQMPLPDADANSLVFARQAAREAVIAARGAEDFVGDKARISGACQGGPVQINFPFDEPLKPDFTVSSLFLDGRRPSEVGAMLRSRGVLDADELSCIASLLKRLRVLVMAGEGSCSTDCEASRLLVWAEAFNLPVLADPLSGLRRFSHPLVIDNYDSVLGSGGAAAENLVPGLIIRFGRYPVSKKATQFASVCGATQIVVDTQQTRDFNAATDMFVRLSPAEFISSLLEAHQQQPVFFAPATSQSTFLADWLCVNDKARERIEEAQSVRAGFEGAFVRRLVSLAPDNSCLFAANSMSIRALDTFYLKGTKKLTVLCNRGLNGIDGTTSTAFGAAYHFAQTTLLAGDLSILHDISAFALQREMRVQRHSGSKAVHIVVVLLNNNGGGIFDMLPQKSEEDYFERLFLTPQDVNFEAAMAAFNVPYCRVETVEEFDVAYRGFLGVEGISFIEVPLPLLGLAERYAPYWSIK